jgi:hypothetical protein
MFKKQIFITAIAFSSALAQAGDQFSLLDIDGNGTLSQEEASALPELAAKWEELDVDANGALTVEEFSRFKPEVKGMGEAVKMQEKLSDTK